jgi:SpoIID/LytB domain protein
MISFETSNLEQGVMAIENLCTRFSEIQTEKVEPMMNLLCYFRNGKWVIHLFPRRLHRPWQFFEEGDRRLLISPASVDFGGVFITPRREDFDKIKASDIEDIFCQVSLGDGEFLKLKMSITNYKLQITNYKLNSGTMKQPKLKIGILVEREINFCLMDEFLLNTNGLKYSGYQSIRLEGSIIFLNGLPISGKELLFVPLDEKICSFELSDVTIGVQFHWERKENQFFKGALQFQVEAKKLVAINILSLEDYLISVISSEMSATSSMELLKAHAITSRSWLIAQVVKGKELRQSRKEYQTIYKTDTEYIRWYDREDHTLFDVCADDHCQRYQGITRQTSTLVEKAVNETSGQILMFNDQVCDARFSKSCGGVTETFEKVWEPVVHPYLQKVMDCENVNSITSVDLTKEADAEKWIRTSPDAFCNTTDYKVLSQVLNDYDQETVDFYRWKVTYSQEEISVLIAAKTGIDFGTILNLVPIERGFSGRIVKMEILGAKKRLIVGKELEIRKILSVSHLYSSAFVVDRYEFTGEIPGKFILTGAGWGHGVGLCQIGAAMMGEKGYSHEEILMHYFVGAELKKAY